MGEPIHPHAGPLDSALCDLAGCGQAVHIVWTMSMPVFLSLTAEDLARTGDAYTATWHVECEAGHTILVPPDTAADFYQFGQCTCAFDTTTGDERDDSLCQHNDLARLRRVVRAPDDDGTCRMEGCPNLGGVWRECP